MKKKGIFKLLILVFILTVTGCTNKTVNKENNIVIDDYKLSISKMDNCTKEKKYYNYNGRTVYLVCLDEIYLKSDKKTTTLKEYLTNPNKDFDKVMNDIIKQLNMVESLWDGGTAMYKNNSKDANITIIQCQTIEGNNDIYIGDSSMKKQDRYCHQ